MMNNPNANQNNDADAAEELDGDFVMPSEDDAFDEDEWSEETSLETEQEAAAWQYLARTTDNACFHGQPILYDVASESVHFQSADAMAVNECDDGSILVATYYDRSVHLYKLPPPGEITEFNLSHDNVVALGTFDVPCFSGYSLALSMSPNTPHRGTLAVSGDHGCVALYTLDISRPSNNKQWGTPYDDERIWSPTGLTVYRDEGIPLFVSEIRDSVQKDKGEYKTWGRLAKVVFSDLPNWRILQEIGFAGNNPVEGYFHTYRAMQDASTEDLLIQPPTLTGMPLWLPQLEAYFKTKMDLAPLSADTALPGGRHQAITLNCIMTLGFADAEEARTRGVNTDMMANGVKYGLVDGRHRMLVSNQDGFIYIFEDSMAPIEHRMCTKLNGQASKGWKMMPVNVFKTHEVFLGVGLENKPTVYETAAIGPLGAPVNYAVPSPDGRWIAVTYDDDYLILLDQQNGYSKRKLELEAPRPPADPDVVEGLEILKGGQYCCWNSTSTLVAISSDALRAVFVFMPVSGDCVLKITDHNMPCLAIQFAPWDPELLIYAERGTHVHIRKVPNYPVQQSARDDLGAGPVHNTQLLRMPRVSELYLEENLADTQTLQWGAAQRQINGIAATSNGDLFVATNQALLFRYTASWKWSIDRHRLWPRNCRDVIRELLMCHYRRDNNKSNASIGTVPPEVLQDIVKKVAATRREWIRPATHHADWRY